MQTPGQQKTNGIERAIIAISCVIMVALLGLACSGLPGVLSFRPSYFTLIPGTGVVALLVLLVVLNTRRARLGNMFWFALYLGSVLFWGVSEFLLYLSATDEAAVFWRSFTGVASTFAPLTMFFFVLGLTHPKSLERKIIPWLVLCSATMVFLNIFWATNLIVDHSTTSVLHLFYGRELNFTQAGGLIYIAWLLGMFAVIAVMLVKHFRNQKEAIKRRQIRFFLWGTFIFVGGTMVFDVTLPLAFGIETIPPFGMLLAAVMAVFYGYGLLRYNLFALNPATVAPNILQTMAEAVIVTDPAYRIIFSNLQSERLLGDTVHGLAGAALYTSFKASDWQNIRQSVEAGVAAQQRVNLDDIALVHGRQTLAYVDVSVSQVMDDDGKLAGVVWVMNDISNLKDANARLVKEKASVERKVIERTRELSEAQARLVASVRNLPFGFGLLGPDLDFVLSNEALSVLLNEPIPTGAASRRAFAKVIENFRPSIDLEACIKEVQNKQRPQEYNVEIGPRFYRFVIVPILTSDSKKGAQSIGTAFLMEDTTEVKALERSRDEFFSIASHELRTPLTAIRGNSDMIMQYYQKALKDPEMKQMVGDIHAASLRLIDIVNDFLDMSRLEQDKIVFKNEPFDIEKLVAEIVREYDVTGSRRKLKLEVVSKGVPLVVADTARVRQILINLLSNAIRYTEKGGVTIGLEQSGQTVKLSVTDTGHGIPLEVQHLLFRKFQQATGSILTRDNTQSTGLGLYISKLLAEGVKGDLRLAWSEVGKGSTFVLELPAKNK